MVSIIIPMYNASGYISTMIESIRKQTYQNWDLIIVDDISTDNSKDIVERYTKLDSRIKLHIRSESDPKGASSCRNIGLSLSKREYVIFFDADDYIAEYCIEQRVLFMESNRNFDFAVFPVIAFKNSPNELFPHFFGYGRPKDVLGSFINRTLPFLVVSNIYKRVSILANNILWDIKLMSFQDSDFNLSVLSKKMSFCITNLKPDYYWRVAGNEGSISKKLVTREHVKSHLYFFNKLSVQFSDKYAKDLLILTYLLLNIFIEAKSINAINILLNNKFFNAHLFLKYKLSLLVKLDIARFSKIQRKIILCLLCPGLKFRNFVCYYKWRRWRKEQWNLLSESIIQDSNIC